MQQQLALVHEFHQRVHSTWNDQPAKLEENVREQRIKLLQSEVDELAEAMREDDIEHVAKELCDVLYALCGTVGALGFADKMEAMFEEVHRSNMSKDYSGTPNSKAIKGPNYREADMKSALAQ